MYRLVVIDDEYIVVQGIKALISRLKLDYEVVGAAYDGIQGLEVIRSEKPDVVITDIRIPGLDGLSVIEAAKEECPDTYFIVISGYSEFVYAQRALTLGVKDYIDKPVTADKLKNALEVVDKIIAGETLDRRDIELLIEKIVVNEDGMPEITLKYGLSNLISYSPADEMNRRENTIIAIVMKLIAEDERGFTSAKYLSEHITDLGFKKTKQSILPYIELMKGLGILETTDNPLKPYNIVKSKEEITQLTKDYLPDVSAETTAKQLSDDYLHGISDDRRYAGNGI